MKRAITTHLGDFVAIIVLLVLSVVVAGYVLSHERLRFPFIQSSPYTLNAEFSTGQAVTPGQGQSVRVSGVQIGEIGGITLKNGVAMVRMDIDQKYKNLIHTDATALLRPKTGLKDMFIEVDPGNSSAPVAKQGYTIPVSNTLPDINPDEILASLDGDTREYLQLLINGAGQGLRGNGGNELAGVFQRFEPTHQDLARLNRVVAQRGQNLRRLINSLQRLNTALVVKKVQLVSLVDASAKVFHAFAAENQNVSRAVADLPGTLAQTTATLRKVITFANILGPAARSLLPAAAEIPAANQALTNLAVPATPIVRDQIRPFVIAARPFVQNLRPAATNLAIATPDLGRVFNVLNHLFNMLGYCPARSGGSCGPNSGAQHGYLWWLAWLNHDARTLFSVQDANGDFRPIFAQASCATYDQLIANTGPLSGLLYNVVGLLSKPGFCKAYGGGAVDVGAALAQYQRSLKAAQPQSASSTKPAANTARPQTANPTTAGNAGGQASATAGNLLSSVTGLTKR